MTNDTNQPRPLVLVPIAEGSKQPSAPSLRLLRGAWLKTLRQAAGLTQTDVTRALGYESGRALSAFEAGGSSVGTEHFPKLAEIYKVNAVEFGRKMLAVSDPTLFGMIFPGEQENVGGHLVPVVTKRQRKGTRA